MLAPFRLGIKTNITSNGCMKHAMSRSHQDLSKATDAIGNLVNGHIVPEALEFQKVLDAISKKRCGLNNVPGLGKNKCRKLVYCLAESLRVRAREHIKAADVASIHQDCRKGVLQIRYRICDHLLATHTGVLGQVNLARKFDLSAEGIKQGTLAILQDFATPRAAVPFPRKRSCPKLSDKLYKHFCTIIELFDADAAEDEQLAGRKLRNEPENHVTFPSMANREPHVDHYLPAMPNLRIFNKDTTHAARFDSVLTYCKSDMINVSMDAHMH